MAFLLLFTAIITPYEAAFLTPDLQTVLFWLNRIVDLCFISDFVMQFFMAFQDFEKHGIWITSHSKIACKYMKAWFTIDLVSIIPFDTIAVIMRETGTGPGQTGASRSFPPERRRVHVGRRSEVRNA
jgi:hypothetical protein